MFYISPSCLSEDSDNLSTEDDGTYMFTLHQNQVCMVGEWERQGKIYFLKGWIIS